MNFDQSPYIVAEIGNNHDGDFNKAKDLVYAAKEAGVDSVKFQCIDFEKWISPDLPIFKRAQSSGKKSQLERLKAIEFYESAFMTSDEDVESLSELGLAEAYLRKGNLKESIKHAKRSLEINSDRTRGKIVLAIGLTKNGEKEEALKILEQLFSSNSNDSQVNMAIANYHSSFENNKEAINISWSNFFLTR